MTAIRRAVVFRGTVQGVGFRWTTCRVAESHPVRGWVRNEADGTVRCEVEGEAADIEAFFDAVTEAMDGYVQSRLEAPSGSGPMPAQGVEIHR
jgi:acylphosphatase